MTLKEKKRILSANKPDFTGRVSQLDRKKAREAAVNELSPYLYILKQWGTKSHYANKVGITSSAISLYAKHSRGIGANVLNELCALLKAEHERRELEKASAPDELAVRAEV
jgi:DNA-binding Xre family transcriptional regulator